MDQNEATDQGKINFEDILGLVGKFNRYQIALITLLSFPLFFGTASLYIQTFTAGHSEHWCRTWEDDNCDWLNLTEDECEDLKKNLSIPFTIDENHASFNECYQYDMGGIDLKTALGRYGNEKDRTSLRTVPCDEGWVYDTSVFESTIVMDFNLVCEKSHLPNITQSVYFAGYLVGSALMGTMADLVGRRYTYIACIIIGPLLCMAYPFTVNVWMYMVIRFFAAVMFKGLNLVGYIIAMEIVTPGKRVIVGNFMWILFALGYFQLIFWAKMFRSNWRILHLAVALQYFPVILLALFCVPESPRWLVNKDRYDTAEKVLRKMAKINKKEVPADFSETVQKVRKSNNESKGTVRDLFRSWFRIMMILNLCYNWFVQSVVYYGFSLTTSELGIDPYLSFVISGCIEIPAYLLCMFVAEKFGRKASTFGTMLLSGIFCCLTPFIPAGMWRVVMAMSGKFFITMSFSIVYTWSAELMPTFLRSSALGVFSMSSRIGGILVPLLLILEEVWVSLPFLVFGSVSILAALLCLVLPETKGHPLPSTIKDLEAFTRRTHKATSKVHIEGFENADGKYGKMNEEEEDC